MKIEGKTKVVTTAFPFAEVVQKDDITAGDGLRRDVIPGKGEIAARTTANVFRYLAAHSVATHFVSFTGPNRMTVRWCEMIPVEVVIRRIPYGSYAKRTSKTERLDPPVVEYFLKDDENHDPLIDTFHGLTPHADEIPAVALRVFEVLEAAWRRLGITLVDLKIELGVHSGRLLVADVIDNDSWRIWEGGDRTRMLDKQVYRDSTVPDLDLIRANYERVAEMTGQFVG
jgi:phosphoribosylaminoimidazole-succinocarboxamide synthase